ncbi:uncharacterized protein LOC126784398 [Argentina anserina]|uniref:uncharacterized protein LOC126784398 n=1 Tax=Argentina anserina TaxID=57926 RepID=UPI0021767505|nr:uncharacterized protein LOC126784398 [Potentilla anserina]
MLSPFSCAFFHPETSDEFDESIITDSPCSTPRRSSCRRSGGLIHRIHHSNKDNKNPYSTRGLDKFSALMADLEEKRKQIYAQTGSEDDTFVRFVYKDSNDNVPVPIVLKLKDKKQEEQKKKPHHQEKHAEALDKLTVKPSVVPAKEVVLEQQPKTNMFDFLSNINFRRPSFYLPVVVVLILVLLAVFGRSVAILCTSIGWYAIPTLKEQSSQTAARRRRASKPKKLVKRSSQNKISTSELSSPKSEGNSSPHPRKHDHRKSW